MFNTQFTYVSAFHGINMENKGDLFGNKKKIWSERNGSDSPASKVIEDILCHFILLYSSIHLKSDITRTAFQYTWPIYSRAFLCKSHTITLSIEESIPYGTNKEKGPHPYSTPKRTVLMPPLSN